MVAALDIEVIMDAVMFAPKNGNSIISGRANVGAIVNSGMKGHSKSVNIAIADTTIPAFSQRLESN